MHKHMGKDKYKQTHTNINIDQKTGTGTYNKRNTYTQEYNHTSTGILSNIDKEKQILIQNLYINPYK